MEVTGILLAAGQGRRFGGGKLMHRLDSGDSIGVASYRNLRAALERVLVVVRLDDTHLHDYFLRQNACLIQCEDASLGLSHSLLAGVRAAPVGDGLIVALADMPFVKVDTIKQLAQSIRGGAIVAAPYYSGQRGNPIAFAPILRQELLLVSGDMGAREVVKRHANEMTAVHCEDPGVLRDIDTPEDLPD